MPAEPTPLIAVDARLAPLVEGSTPLDGASPALRRALVVVLEGDDAWERLRRLRLGGVRAAAVLVTQADAPPDRARLESGRWWSTGRRSPRQRCETAPRWPSDPRG